MNLTSTSAIEAPAHGFLAQFMAKEPATPAPEPTPATETAPEPVNETVTEPTTPAAETAPTTTEPAKETPAAEEDTRKGLDVFDDKPETTTTPVAEPAEDIPAGVTTKAARESWKEGRLAIKRVSALEREVGEWKAKAEAAGKLTTADPALKELETLKAWKAEIDPVLHRVAYEKTDDFAKAIAEPRRQIATAAVELARQCKLTPDQMDGIFSAGNLSVQRKLLAEALESVEDDFAKDDLKHMVREWNRLDQLEDSMAANAFKARQEAEKNETTVTAQKVTERKAAEMRAVTELKPKLLNVAKTLLAEGDTADGYAERLIKEANETSFDDHEPGDKAYMAVASLILRDMAPAYKKALSRIATLEAQISGMSATTPKAATGTAANSAEAPKATGFFEQMFGKAPSWKSGSM